MHLHCYSFSDGDVVNVNKKTLEKSYKYGCISNQIDHDEIDFKHYLCRTIKLSPNMIEHENILPPNIEIITSMKLLGHRDVL